MDRKTRARGFIMLSIILSVLALVFFIIALFLPYWKFIRLRHNLQIVDYTSIDLLVHLESEQFLDSMYRSNLHYFGIYKRCIEHSASATSSKPSTAPADTIKSGRCGHNYVPKFDDSDFKACHSVKLYHYCIFHSLSSSGSLPASDSSEEISPKCECRSPDYITISMVLLYLSIACAFCCILINSLRLINSFRLPIAEKNKSKQRTRKIIDDRLLKILSAICSLFTLVFLIILLILQKFSEKYEAFKFFESLRQHYSRVLISEFSKNFATVIDRFDNVLDVKLGASFVFAVFAVLFTSIAFLCSSGVHIGAYDRFPPEQKNMANELRIKDGESTFSTAV
ncbi:unnamed protein product [Didymodactylos carnosus]|uniref:Uncharacterized protein n=1 Tax=Didymodactylos carnosus TaxID=1234261 RepID=A0A815G8H3_9BILA|nr:unnamed protein product [Didymodactylos carnosus]CAF1352042.1 unnamed protein product [Didymodactylos carnosus]CAF4162509.1 unnamed protein product [Didymodactylos carnosus]CAF4191768.1 unnamed protein product [Didymodactylos carnosus]